MLYNGTMKRKYMLTISGVSIYSIFFIFQLSMALIFIFPIIAVLFSVIVIFVFRYYSLKRQNFGLLYIKSYFVISISALVELLCNYLYKIVFLNGELFEYVDEEEIYTYTSIDYIFILLSIFFTTMLTYLWIKNKEKQRVGLIISFIIVIIYTSILYASMYFIETFNKTQNKIDNNITIEVKK